MPVAAVEAVVVGVLPVWVSETELGAELTVGEVASEIEGDAVSVGALEDHDPHDPEDHDPHDSV